MSTDPTSAHLPPNFLDGALEELLQHAPAERQQELLGLRSNMLHRRYRQSTEQQQTSNDPGKEQVAQPDSPTINATRSSSHTARILALLIVFRVYNALAITSFYVPDEYYQALEVAHYTVFGHGYLTWEWWPHIKLRGFLHPLIFTVVYKLLQVLRLETTGLLIGLPKIMQGVLAALADFWTYKLTHKTLGYSVARWTLACSLVSWYSWYALPRTLANSLETTTSAAAFYYWSKDLLDTLSALSIATGSLQKNVKTPTFTLALFFTGLTVIIRPSALPTFIVHVIALLWLVVRFTTSIANKLNTETLLQLRKCRQRVAVLFIAQALFMTLTLLVSSIIIDSIAYAYLHGNRDGTGKIGISQIIRKLLQQLFTHFGIDTEFSIFEDVINDKELDIVFPPWNFARLNVMYNLSAFYGTHPWHWYFSNALPTILTTLLPVTLYGIWQLIRLTRTTTTAVPVNTIDNNKLFTRIIIQSLLITTTATICVYSWLEHKEFRFLSGLMPFIMLITGYGLHTISTTTQISQPSSPSKKQQTTTSRQYQRQRTAQRYMAIIFIVITQSLVGWYTAQIYQRGVVDVMYWIRHEAANLTRRDPSQHESLPLHDLMRVYFLMPCHSTPYYSYIGYPIRMGFVTCEPPLNGQSVDTYKDKGAVLYSDMEHHLNNWQWTSDKWQWHRRCNHFTRDQIYDEQCKEINSNGVAATHIVMFDTLWRVYNNTGVLQGYQECARMFNSHWHDEAYRRGDVIVACVKTT